MKAFQFVSLVARHVSKTAGQSLKEVDPDANVLSYFDSGAALDDQELAAKECAEVILFEAGYPTK